MPFKKKHIPWNKGKKCPGLGGRPPGGIPWNKGKVFKQILGNKHASKGDKAKKNAGNHRAQTLYKVPEKCSLCKKLKASFYMVRHHKNGNTLDNRKLNIQWLCRNCHPKIHNRFSKLK